MTFGIDETVKTITIPLANDDETEGDETVNLALSNPTGGSLADPSTATLTIVDRTPTPPDRTPPTIVLGQAPKSMTRAAFLRGVTVAITPNEPSSLVVELLGTTDRAMLARAGDLTLSSRTLPLAAGRRTVRLQPTPKLVAQAHRRFTARLLVTATDAAGNRTTVTRRIVVRQK